MTSNFQENLRKKTQTILKVSIFLPYIVAILCTLLFFSYEYVEKNSSNYLNAKAEYQADIDSVTVALSVLKKLTKNTPEYSKYKDALLKKSESKKVFNRAKEDERVFYFKSFKYFLYEFGPNTCWLIFLLFVTFRSFYFERKNIGIKVLYTLMLSVIVFKFFYIFQAFQDFSKATYYLMTLVSAGIIVLAVYLITKFQDHYINILKKNFRDLAIFSIKNTKEEKKEEALHLIEKIAKQKETALK